MESKTTPAPYTPTSSSFVSPCGLGTRERSSRYHDDGKVVSAITDVCEAAVKPENVCKETKTKDIYLDWFETEEEAKEMVKEALNA